MDSSSSSAQPTPDTTIPDADLPVATQALLLVLDDVAATAPYAADPREAAAKTAAAFAAYFRTPD